MAFRDILILTTNWGICFRSNSNPGGFNRWSSDTVLAQPASRARVRCDSLAPNTARHSLQSELRGLGLWAYNAEQRPRGVEYGLSFGDMFVN